VNGARLLRMSCQFGVMFTGVQIWLTFYPPVPPATTQAGSLSCYDFAFSPSSTSRRPPSEALASGFDHEQSRFRFSKLGCEQTTYYAPFGERFPLLPLGSVVGEFDYGSEFTA
jgi:hypothetical protein